MIAMAAHPRHERRGCGLVTRFSRWQSDGRHDRGTRSLVLILLVVLIPLRCRDLSPIREYRNAGRDGVRVVPEDHSLLPYDPSRVQPPFIETALTDRSRQLRAGPNARDSAAAPQIGEAMRGLLAVLPDLPSRHSLGGRSPFVRPRRFAYLTPAPVLPGRFWRAKGTGPRRVAWGALW
jgi:hypothetical protein